MTATIIHVRISVDDKPSCLVTIERTEDSADVRVTLDRFLERDTLRTELKNWSREGKQRIDLVADAFRALATLEAAHASP